MLGKGISEEVPFMFVAAAIPSTLLQMSTISGGRPEGAYGGIDLSFFSDPRCGDYQSKIYLIGKPRKTDKGSLYRFEGIVSQDGSPLARGKILVYSQEEFSLERIKQIQAA